MGKSELAKTLANYYFGSEEAMVRLDMSEFMERHTVSKLIGSPPGRCGEVWESVEAMQGGCRQAVVRCAWTCQSSRRGIPCPRFIGSPSGEECVG